MRCWEILELEPTNDIARIQEAYRKKLMVTNPEDDPRGFMKLREALENAIKEAKSMKPGETGEKRPEAEDHRGHQELENGREKIDGWMRKTDAVYSAFSKRTDIRQWEDLLDDEVCVSLETRDEAVIALLEYLMENSHVSKNIRRLIRDKLDLASVASELRTMFPRDFVEFMTEITDVEEYPEYGYLKGSDDMPFDRYIDMGLELKDAIMSNDIQKAHSILMQMESTGIEYPLLNIEKAMLACREQKYDEAKRLVDALLPEHAERINLLLVQGDILYGMGGYGQAYEKYKAAVEREPECQYGVFYMGKCMDEMGMLKEAKAVFSRLLDEAPYNMTIKEAFQNCNKKYLRQIEDRIEAGENDFRLCFELAESLTENGQYKEAVVFLELLEGYKDRIETFHQLAAEIYFNLGDDEKTLANLQKCSGASFRIIESVVYYRQGDAFKALDHLKEIIESDGENLSALFKMGQIQYEIGAYKGCVETMSKLIEEASDYHVAYGIRAKALYELGRYGEAIKDCDAVAEIEMYDVEAHICRIKILAEAGEYKMASEWLDWMKEEGMKGSMLDFLDGFIKEGADAKAAERIYRGIIKARQQNKAKAASDDGPRLELADLSEVYYRMVLMRYDETADVGEYDQEQLDEMIELIDEGLEENKNSVHLRELLGDIYSAFDMNADAIEEYGKVIKLVPGRVGIYRMLAEISMRECKWSEAVSFMDKVIEMDALAEDHQKKADCLIRLERLDEALASLTLAFSLKSELPEALNSMGMVLEYKENDDGALEYYLGAIALGEENDSICLDAYINLSALYMRRHAYVQAIETLQRGYEMSGNTDMLRLISERCCMAGNTSAAKKAIERYRKEEKLGRLSFLYNREVAAICKASRGFERAFDLYDMVSMEDSSAGLEAGKLQYYQGKYKKALKYFRKAIDMLDEERLLIEDDFAKGYYYLWAAKACIGMGDMKSAAELGEKGLSYIPAEYENMYRGWLPKLRCLISGLYAVKGQTAAAERLLKETAFSRKCENCTNRYCMEAFRQLGYVYEIQGRTPDAEKCYSKALELAPGNADVYCSLKHLKGKRIWL